MKICVVLLCLLYRHNMITLETVSQFNQWHNLLSSCCFYLNLLFSKIIIVQHNFKQPQGSEHMSLRHGQRPRPALLWRKPGAGHPAAAASADRSAEPVQRDRWTAAHRDLKPSFDTDAYLTRYITRLWWLCERKKMAQKDTLLNLFAGG